VTRKSSVPRVSKKKKPAFVPKPKQASLFASGSGMRVHAEEDLQRNIVKEMRLVVPQLTPVHAPNQLARTSQQRILHTEMGMHPGVSDLVVYGPGRFVAFLEIKIPGRYATAEQVHFLRLMESYGFPTGILKSVNDLQNFLHAHGIRTREHLFGVQQDMLESLR
jgi:hypothetical protein